MAFLLTVIYNCAIIDIKTKSEFVFLWENRKMEI